MGSLQGPVICPSVRAKQAGAYTVPVTSPSMKPKLLRSELWGCRESFRAKTKVATVTRLSIARRRRAPQCSFSSSSDGNGSTAENFNENDEDYVNSSIVEAGMESRC